MTEVVAAARPEEQLPGLLASLLELRAAMWSNGMQPALDDDFAPLVKNIAVTSALSQRFLYAVAGHQGTGKTTLLREAYGLDGTWLRPNAGRGETLPILVTESRSVTSPVEVTGWLWRLGDSEGTAGQLVRARAESADEWWQEVRAAGKRIVCAEIVVPADVFGVDGAGFVLLPGYEDDVDDPDADYDWRTLMRQSLVASAGAIVVVNAGTLATGQDELLADLRGLYRTAVSPIVAVSHTEHMRDEAAREQLRDRAREVFGVDRNQVILTGEGTKYRGEWLDRFREMVGSGSAGVSGMRSMQLESLGRLLHRQLMPFLERVQTEAYQGSLLNTNAEKYGEWMELLAESTRNAREEYASSLHAIAERQSSQAMRVLDEAINARGGWELVGERMTAWVKMESDRLGREKDASAVRIWNEASCASTGFKSSLPDALEALEASALNRALAASWSEGPAKRSNTTIRTDSTTIPLSGLEVPDDVLADACFLAGQGSLALTAEDGTRRIVATDTHSELFAGTIRCLPAMVFGALGAAARSSTIDVHDGMVTVQAEAGDDPEELLNRLTTNRRAILKGALLFLGADVLADGKIDSVPALAHSIQVFLFGAPTAGAGAASAAAVPAAVAGTLTGVLVAGAAAAALLQYGNSANAKGYARARAIVNGAATRTVQAELDNFDAFMRFVTQRVAARLNGYLELDHAAVQSLTLQRALAQARVSTARTLTALS
jgi:hypothetical protein